MTNATFAAPAVTQTRRGGVRPNSGRPRKMTRLNEGEKVVVVLDPLGENPRRLTATVGIRYQGGRWVTYLEGAAVTIAVETLTGEAAT